MLAWSEGLIRPYESAWALVQRFRVLNRPTPGDLARVLAGGFATKGPANSPYAPEYGKSGDFDHGALNRVFGLSEDQIAALFPETYGIDRFFTTESRLKYCPRCMEFGYHTAMHQAVPLERCPVHEVLLIDRCPKCAVSLPYTIGSGSYTVPFTCRCGYALVDTRTLRPLTDPVPPEILEPLNLFVERVRQITEDPRALVWPFDISVLSSPTYSSFPILAKSLGLPDSFANLFQQRDPLVAVKVHSVLVPAKPRRRVRKVAQEPHPEQTFEYPYDRLPHLLERVFLAYDRHLLARLEREHAECIRAMSLVPRFINIRYAPGACPVALGYFRWRYFWLQMKPDVNDIVTPRGMLPNYASDLLPVVRAWITNWDIAAGDMGTPGASLSAMRWCIRRMFLMTLQRTFLAALSLCRQELVHDINPGTRHWPGIGKWTYPRVYVLMGTEDGPGAVLISHHPFRGFREIDGAVSACGQHENGAFRIVKELQGWYYNFPSFLTV